MLIYNYETCKHDYYFTTKRVTTLTTAVQNVLTPTTKKIAPNKVISVTKCKKQLKVCFRSITISECFRAVSALRIKSSFKKIFEKFFKQTPCI